MYSPFLFKECSGCVLEIIVSLKLVPKALNVTDIMFYNYKLLLSKLTLLYKKHFTSKVIH